MKGLLTGFGLLADDHPVVHRLLGTRIAGRKMKTVETEKKHSDGRGETNEAVQ